MNNHKKMTVGSKKIKEYGKKILLYISHDPSSWTLILANLITLATAIAQKWSIGNLLWIYFVQSMIIGFFNVVKILSLKKFSTKDFMVGDREVNPTKKTKVISAAYFILFYGLFHLIFVFLLTEFITDNFNIFLILKVSLLFFVNHLFSFIYNFSNDNDVNIGRLMFQPFYRILPMHLTIIFAGMITVVMFILGGLIILISFIFFGKTFINVQMYLNILGNVANFIFIIWFLILKTLADVAAHVLEHTGNFYKDKQLIVN